MFVCLSFIRLLDYSRLRSFRHGPEQTWLRHGPLQEQTHALKNMLNLRSWLALGQHLIAGEQDSASATLKRETSVKNGCGW